MLQKVESLPNLVGLGSKYLKERMEELESEKINLLVIGRASSIAGLESSLEVIERMNVATSEDLSKSIQGLDIDGEDNNEEEEEEESVKNGTNENYDLDSFADSVSYAESYADSSVNHSDNSD